MAYVTLAKQKDKLDGSVQKAAMDFLGKLQENDTTAGLHIEPIQNSQDSRVRTGRVNSMWRAVLFKLPMDGDAHYIYWGTWPHDKAIEKAKNSVLRVNPVFGFMEVIEETAPNLPTPTAPEVLTPTAPEELASTAQWTNGLSKHSWTHARLVNEAGIHESVARRVLTANNEAAFYRVIDRAPDVQGLILLDLANGRSMSDVRDELGLEDYVDDPGTPEETKIIEGAKRDPAKLQFAFVGDNPEELREALESNDFEAWRTFLHPEQRQYASKSWNGPFRLSGGAGTGKTVVILHRANELAARNVSARIMLTTFTRTLASALTTNLKKLAPELLLATKPGDPGILTAGIDSIAHQIVFGASESERTEAALTVLGASHASMRNRPDNRDPSAQWKQALAAVDHGLDTELANPTFLEQEYIAVFLANQVTSKDDYLKVPRVGRGTALNRAKRLAVWRLVDAYRQANQLGEIITYPEIVALAVAIIRKRAAEGIPRPADHVLVDEAQDFHAAHWLLLRELAEQGRDDLFIAEDSHQRIYGQKVPLSRFGIAVVGRSRRLTLNYRTTAQNLDYAVGLLSGVRYEDIEGGEEKSSDYRSIRTGPAPIQDGTNNVVEELDHVAARLRTWREEGVRGDTIGLLARTKGQIQKLQSGMAERGIEIRDIDRPGDGTAPLVMSMHRAKGMEFSRVILFAINDGLLPLGYEISNLPASEAQDALLRERSLLYVAATRARDELVVSWSGTPSSLLLGV